MRCFDGRRCRTRATESLCWTTPRSSYSTTRQSAPGVPHVAVADDHIVGFATTTLVGEKAELDDLFVDPPWMRRDVARALILKAVSAARAVGSRRIEVTANEHARSFHDAVGFVADSAVATQFGPGTRMHLDIAP
jgi:GNAT superfamily N-acetyltransferase